MAVIHGHEWGVTAGKSRRVTDGEKGMSVACEEHAHRSVQKRHRHVLAVGGDARTEHLVVKRVRSDRL